MGVCQSYGGTSLRSNCIQTIQAFPKHKKEPDAINLSACVLSCVVRIKFLRIFAVLIKTNHKMNLSIKYNRVSTMKQSGERFKDDSATYDLTLFDKVSGSVPFDKRPEGAKLVKLIQEGKVAKVVVEEISRLGRNVMDVSKTLAFLEEHKVNLNIRNMGIESMVEGKPSATFRMILQIMASISEMEKEHIKERTSQGRAVAVAKGVKMGRTLGASETQAEFLNKEKNKRAVKMLKEKALSIRDIARLTELAPSTIQKLKHALKEQPELSSKHRV
jgi:DNA invertase Pin-like site-specific DNA recombinase